MIYGLPKGMIKVKNERTLNEIYNRYKASGEFADVENQKKSLLQE